MSETQIEATAEHNQKCYAEHRCIQCDKDMSPVEWITGAVCGKCCRANHRKVVGK